MTTIRVFIVEASVLMHRLLRLGLREEARIDVVGIAVDGPSALAQIARTRPDVVLLALELPGTRGADIVRALRESGFMAPILMLAATTSEPDSAMLDALAAGASGYVSRPSTGLEAEHSVAEIARTLLPKIKTVLAERK